MASALRPGRVKTALGLGAVLAILVVRAPGQQPAHYYNVDTEVRVAGTIRGLVLEPRYESAAPFLVLTVEEKGGSKTYTVEVSPAWFFREDLHPGETVEVVGSLLPGKEGETATLIARQVRFRGETVSVRDARGFPTWRGGAKRRGRGRGSGS